MTEDKLSLRKYAAVIAILIVLVMTVLDVTLVNVALPVMAEKFGVSDSYAVWIVTIYQLAITMLLPLSSAGDLFSYRRTSSQVSSYSHRHPRYAPRQAVLQ